MNLLVSIIIPIYNSEKFIYDTVTSCINQTYSNLEIILVNDGSTDKTEEIILSITDKRIKYYKINNVGGCEARNFGIKNASGQLYQFLDHDDVLDVDKIFYQIKHYKTNGSNYIYSANMGTVHGDIKTVDQNYELYQKDFTPEQYFDTLLNQFGKYITTGAWLVPAEISALTHGWDSNSGINDDGEYFMRLILLSKGIIYCEKSTFYFRRDVEGSLSKQFGSKEVYLKWLYSYKSYAKNFLLNLPGPKAKELGRKALSKYYCSSYPNYPDLLRECKLEIEKLGFKTPTAYGGNVFRLISSVLGVDNTLKIYSLKKKIMHGI
jgi:glycosyltransferase involved in cell wall biosynthesis